MRRDEIQSLLDNIPVTPESMCSYFSDRPSQSRAFRVDGDLPPELFNVALERGYRRCGDIYYQQTCEHCHLCLSYRVLVQSFTASRSQRRVAARNSDVEWRVVEPILTSEKEALYLRYQHSQHYVKDIARPDAARFADAGYDEASLLDTLEFQMYTNPRSTRELQLHCDGQLLGFGTLDFSANAASAVYFVFDPDHARRSLGTLAILAGLDWAREREMQYYYLGFYIPGHPKMDYKRRFMPAEIRDPEAGKWAGAPYTEIAAIAD